MLIGVDPGSDISGVCVLLNGQIVTGFDVKNTLLWAKISAFFKYGSVTVVVEDIRPYSQRLTMQVIETCKVIGELTYRLRNARGVKIELVPRSDVKKWVFDAFAAISNEKISRKMARKGKINKDGSPRKPSFNYVDDRVVVAAMQEHWKMEKSKKGQPNKWGFRAHMHCWQALGMVSSFIMQKALITQD